MPQIGDIINAKEFGYSRRGNYIYAICGECGNERWVQLRNGLPVSHKCQKCSASALAKLAKTDEAKHKMSEARKGIIGERHSRWQGGRSISREGYVRVWLSPNDFFHSMCRSHNAVSEHRLVMAKHLGRCLHPWEIVHHKNGNPTDNRIENLELGGSNGEHIRDHNKGYQDGFQKGYYDGKDKRIQELELKIKELESNAD